jgi:aryl-alcohol dehydrogenase-like predicted oxidoreductase
MAVPVQNGGSATCGGAQFFIGARNLEQLEPSLAAADYAMSDEQRRQIAQLTPPAPVATVCDEEK